MEESQSMPDFMDNDRKEPASWAQGDRLCSTLIEGNYPSNERLASVQKIAS
jgi:hypothetical protein